MAHGGLESECSCSGRPDWSREVTAAPLPPPEGIQAHPARGFRPPAPGTGGSGSGADSLTPSVRSSVEIRRGSPHGPVPDQNESAFARLYFLF